jgi:hypothetical protein
VASVPQPGQDIAEVPHVENGVDQREVEPLVALREHGQLPQNVQWDFAPHQHPRDVS